MTMASKVGKVIPYSEELLSIKLQNLLMIWSCKVTQQIKYVISLLQQDLCPLK